MSLEAHKVNPAHYDGDACMVKIAEITAPMKGSVTATVTLAMKHLWRAGTKPGESFQTDVGKALWYLNWFRDNGVEEPMTPYERSVLAMLRLAADQSSPEKTHAIIRGIKRIDSAGALKAAATAQEDKR